MMKRGLLILASILIVGSALAQNRSTYFKTIPIDLSDAPEWAKLMYSDDPDVRQVDYEHYRYYQDNPFEKNIHTQNYKHWMMFVQDHVNEDGLIRDSGTRGLGTRGLGTRDSGTRGFKGGGLVKLSGGRSGL